MKKRIDLIVSEMKGFSRNKAQEMIEEGNVLVDGKAILKSSFLVDENCEVTFTQNRSFVSRGAKKLLGAVEVFKLDFAGKVVLDMGASTGGFTQVLLENGAKKVYAVDVGKGELDKALRENERVVNMEGRDIRTLTIDEVKDCDMVVGDLSFISLRHILPKVRELFGKIECMLLFKPQFECGKDIARKYRGVIRDKSVHKNILKEFIKELELYDFVLSDIFYSPIKGKEGNIEYLLHLNGNEMKNIEIDSVVEEAFKKI